MVTGYKDNNCYSNIVNLKYLVLESYHYSSEWGIEKRMWVLHVKPQTHGHDRRSRLVPDCISVPFGDNPVPIGNLS